MAFIDEIEFHVKAGKGGDGDLDIYGLNWRSVFGLDDATLRNDGAGNFTDIEILGLSLIHI